MTKFKNSLENLKQSLAEQQEAEQKEYTKLPQVLHGLEVNLAELTRRFIVINNHLVEGDVLARLSEEEVEKIVQAMFQLLQKLEAERQIRNQPIISNRMLLYVSVFYHLCRCF